MYNYSGITTMPARTENLAEPLFSRAAVHSGGRHQPPLFIAKQYLSQHTTINSFAAIMLFLKADSGKYLKFAVKLMALGIRDW